MKYIEELKPGDLFDYQNQKFILTTDYKQKQDKKIHYGSISLIDGSSRWLAADSMVKTIDLYYRDAENNILLLKEFQDHDDLYKNKNIL